MKRKRFSGNQITVVLQQVPGGVAVGDVCRQVGLSEQTFYRWKKVYGGMLPGEARELRHLRDENAKLKRPSPTCRSIRSCCTLISNTCSAANPEFQPIFLFERGVTSDRHHLGTDTEH